MNARGLRYTALRLAALHPADRYWLLERLPVAAADALRSIGRTPGLAQQARVALSIDPPQASKEMAPTVAVAKPPRAVRELDPAWAALWTEATDSGVNETAMPARLKAALASWVPPQDVEA